MSEITKIQAQVKNQDRCNLYLDGEYCCSLSKFVVLKNYIFVGKEITEQELLELAFESDKDAAFTWSVEYVCSYVPTKKQLIKKLYEKKYTKAVVDYCIQKCEEYRYIDDKKYAQAYVFQNRKVKGKIRLAQELKLKGIKQEYIDLALADYDENNEDGCLILARKRALNKDLDDPKVCASIARFLQYRGYEYDDIKAALDKIKMEAKEND